MRSSVCRMFTSYSAQLARRHLHATTRCLSSSAAPNVATGEGGETRGPVGFEKFLLSRPSEHVVSVELHSPKAKNAFSLESANELLKLIGDLEDDSTVRCIVLSGNGPDFTSGVDLKSFMGVYMKLQETEDIAHRAKLLRKVVEQFQAPFKRLHDCTKPIICIQHGLSLGLGMELAACSDIRFCSSDVKMALREVLIGIAADVGSLQLMPRLAANHSLMNELIFTGRYLTTAEAVQLGFVSRVLESKREAMKQGLEVANCIATRSPVAVQGSKQNMRFSQDKPFKVGLDYNAIWNAAMMQGNDVVKAVEAIMSRTDEKDVKYDHF